MKLGAHVMVSPVSADADSEQIPNREAKVAYRSVGVSDRRGGRLIGGSLQQASGWCLLDPNHLLEGVGLLGVFVIRVRGRMISEPPAKARDLANS